MRIETTSRKLYPFAELPEPIQEKALEKLWGINVDGTEWWDGIYDDAERIGLKILSFDLDCGSYVKARFTNDAFNTAERILKEHGETCETYADALAYRKDHANICQEYADDEAQDASYDGEQLLEELDLDFLRTLQEDYRIMLQKEYEYLTSEEAIKETIEANEWEFTESGDLA